VETSERISATAASIAVGLRLFDCATLITASDQLQIEDVATSRESGSYTNAENFAAR
jgi:hypothetical protein